MNPETYVGASRMRRFGLIADSWIGFIFWSLFLEFVASVYYFNLAAVALNESILLILIFLVPSILGLSRIRKKMLDNPYTSMFLYGISLVGIIGHLSQNIIVKTVFLSIGFFGVMFGITLIFLMPIGKRDRSASGILIGLILLLLSRWSYFSRNLLWISPYTIAISALITIGVIIYYYYETHYKYDIYLDTISGVKTPSPLIGLSLASVIFITFWIFTSYGIVSRWVGIDPYPWGSLIIIFFIIGIYLKNLRITKTWVWWMIGLFGSILLSYGNGYIGLFGGIILALVLPTYWYLVTEKIRMNKVGTTYFVAGLAFIIWTIGAVATVSYDYIPGGEIFRGNEEILLIINFILLIFSTGRHMDLKCVKRYVIPSRAIAKILVVLLVIGLPLATAIRIDMQARYIHMEANKFKVMTWNIQQGFNTYGDVNFNSILKEIRKNGVTVIGLEESDTVRFTSADRDIVEWLSSLLHLYNYYGPKTKDSTYGNALLSAYPIVNASTIILPSKGELAVLLVTQINVSGTIVNVLVAHFGIRNYDLPAQANVTAEIISKLKGPIILMGDFNSEPDSYTIKRLLSTDVIDSYYQFHKKHSPTCGEEMIDYIFYRNLDLKYVEIINTDGDSDHLPIVAKFSV